MEDKKNEITLDSLMSQNKELAVSPQAVTEEVETRVQVLDEADRQKVNEIKESINLQDSQLMSVYGNNTQKGIAQFSEQILSEVRSKDTGDVGELMADLMVKVKDMDFANPKSESLLDKLPFFKGAKQSVEKYLARYQVMENQIDKIQAQLESARMEMLKDIGIFDKLYEKNVDYFQELQYYIVAGEEKVEEMRNQVLPKLYEDAKAKNEPMAMQVVKDFEENINRFEKRIFDLKTSKTVAIQTAPQIKLIQNNDKLLVDKVTDAINNTIPLWKSQVVIALGVNKQAQVLEMQRSVSDTTNELLRKNAANLKQSTLEIAEEAERSTIDVDTLKKVNEDLIATIEESIVIHENARKNREKAEVELVKIEGQLQNALEKTLAPNGQARLN